MKLSSTLHYHAVLASYLATFPQAHASFKLDFTKEGRTASTIEKRSNPFEESLVLSGPPSTLYLVNVTAGTPPQVRRVDGHSNLSLGTAYKSASPNVG